MSGTGLINGSPRIAGHGSQPPAAPAPASSQPASPPPASSQRESPADAPQWLSADEQQAWRTFLEATTLLMDALDRELQAESGLPMSYYEILVRLSEQTDHRLRMSELARSSQSSRSRLSHAVARLEEAGWVTREACPTDRRGAFAVLTEKGLNALAGAAPGHVASVRRHLFSRLDADQVAALHTLSRAVLTPLEQAQPGGLLGAASQPL